MLAQFKASKEYHIEIPLIESLLVKYLTFLQVDDLTEVEDRFDHIEVEFTEDWVVIVQAEMADVHLHFISLSLSLTELFADFKEAFLYLTLDPRFQLLLHVV